MTGSLLWASDCRRADWTSLRAKREKESAHKPGVTGTRGRRSDWWGSCSPSKLCQTLLNTWLTSTIWEKKKTGARSGFSTMLLKRICRRICSVSMWREMVSWCFSFLTGFKPPRGRTQLVFRPCIIIIIIGLMLRLILQWAAMNLWPTTVQMLRKEPAVRRCCSNKKGQKMHIRINNNLNRARPLRGHRGGWRSIKNFEMQPVSKSSSPLKTGVSALTKDRTRHWRRWDTTVGPQGVWLHWETS